MRPPPWNRYRRKMRRESQGSACPSDACNPFYYESLEPLPPYTERENEWQPYELAGPSDHPLDDLDTDEQYDYKTVATPSHLAPLGYFIAPEFGHYFIRIGNIVADLQDPQDNSILQLNENNSPSNLLATVITATEPSFRVGITDYSGVPKWPLSLLFVGHNITTASYRATDLCVAQCVVDEEFIVELNRDCVREALNKVPKKQAFLIYGIATARTLRVNRSNSTRHGFRFGLSAFGLSSNRSTSYTQGNAILGFGLLRLRLKNGAISVNKFTKGANF